MTDSTPTPARNAPDSASTRDTQTTLSEHASKVLLADYGVSIGRETLVETAADAARAAAELGFPVVVKLCGDAIAHKTERDLVRLNLADRAGVQAAAEELLSRRCTEDGAVGLLVAEMVRGNRELIAGLVRDPQLGPCVMLGIGGIFAEALGDVVFAAAPIDQREALRMLRGLALSHLLTEPFRGDPPVDEAVLARTLVGLGRLAVERPDVASVDLNPLIVRGGTPVAVDALVVLEAGSVPTQSTGAEFVQPQRSGEQPTDEEIASLLERFRPLFSPRGIVVAGASSHPGKFGFVTLHNLRRFGYTGEIYPINREGTDVLGRPTFREVSEIPEDAADLVFVCTPNKVNIELLRECAKKGVRAAFVATAGYAEAGEDGRALERELADTADELGMVLAGPNGQGVISTAVSMCAQIVPPYPPAGRIAVVSQSGNLVSSFLNYAVETGVGISKAISCGNQAQTRLADFLQYFGADPDTDVALAYLEGLPDGRQFIDVVRTLTATKPLVLVKGGVAAEGQRAASSHTGSLATDDRIFDGICHQLGVLRAPTIEEAFEWAATLATQPLPRGRRVVVFTTVGGWGVLAADACAAAGLSLIALPDEIRAEIDRLVPARWSRNNPIDLAGGETRETIPEVLDLVCGHRDVDAVIHLGIGIQAASAIAMKTGEFYPDHGLERIVAFHERQDRRYAEAARECSQRHDKPVLTASELVHTDASGQNTGPAGVRAEGRVCYASAHRAVRALRALVDYAEFRSN